MKLLTKLVLLCAAAFAFAAASNEDVTSSASPESKASLPQDGWPASAIPPANAWAGVFNANWR